MAVKFKAGEKIRFQGEVGTITEVVDDLQSVRVRFADARVMRIPWEQVTTADAPTHKQVKGPQG